jgi:catechol-2,3-dioxygenase
VFLMGLLLGSAIAPGFAQGPRLAGDNYMKHVGVAVDDFDGALAFYTQKMGFREAFVRRDDKGQRTLAYVQVSRNTFVELQRTNATRARASRITGWSWTTSRERWPH